MNIEPRGKWVAVQFSDWPEREYVVKETERTSYKRLYHGIELNGMVQCGEVVGLCIHNQMKSNVCLQAGYKILFFQREDQAVFMKHGKETRLVNEDAIIAVVTE
jgi:hypothetical protein